MKTIKKYKIILFYVISLLVTSCTNSNDDYEPTIDKEEKSVLTLKFQNGFDNVGDIYLDETENISSLGQKHRFTTLKYIISNIELTNDKGEKILYHFNDPDGGAFIVNQKEMQKDGVVYIKMKDVPIGNYKKIKMGLGISQQAYLLGEKGQAKFWAEAKRQEMNWSWAAGYIFLKLEGEFGEKLKDHFMTHSGNKGDIIKNNVPDLYREMQFDLPNTIMVHHSRKPAIHFVVDFNQYLSGATKLELNEQTSNEMSTSPFMLSVVDNLSRAFRVDHVHND